MIDYKLNKLPKNTFEFIVALPKEEIEKEKKTAFEDLRRELVVTGFRKGKVPTDLAKKHLSSQIILEQTIKLMLPRVYEEILKKESLKPIASPKIELVKAKTGEDWEVKISLAQKPTIDLSTYKEALLKVKGEAKKTEIWVPGKTEEKGKEVKEQESLNKILSALLSAAKVEISDLILEEELNNRLSRLVDDVQKLGLTIGTYVKSKNTTVEKLREQIKKEIEETYKLEFILMEIADAEKIVVEEKDLEKIFEHIKNPKEKEQAKNNAYFYASIIRKQKVLDYLMHL